MELIDRANIIDLFFLILCLRVVYAAMVRGYICEIFKLISLLTASFLAFQYYASFADSIAKNLSFLNGKYIYFLSFLMISGTTTLAFSLLRLIVLFLARSEKPEETRRKAKWVLFFAGAARAAYSSSIILFVIYLSGLNPLNYQHSLSFTAFSKIAPKIYLESFKLAAGKIEKKNDNIAVNKEVEEYYEAERSVPGNN